jgi:hypothetical protein
LFAYGFINFINGEHLIFTTALGPITTSEDYSCANTMQHQHMSTNGFDSPPTPSKDILKFIELANNISTLIDGTTTKPNIELNKCSSQAFK